MDLYNLPTAANSSRSRSKRGQLEPPTPPHIRGGRLGEGPLPQQIGCLLMRDLRDRLAEVSRMRRASMRVVRHSLAWRMRKAPVVRERENAGHLDLLGGSCLKLTRTTPAMNAADRRRLAPSVRELAGAVADLAEKPGDRPTRQRAADRALAIARRAADSAPQSQAALAASVGIQMVATDVMVFCGVDPEQAADAVRKDRGELHVPDPPPTSRMPFRSGR